jgi:hypothetical protein
MTQSTENSTDSDINCGGRSANLAERAWAIKGGAFPYRSARRNRGTLPGEVRHVFPECPRRAAACYRMAAEREDSIENQREQVRSPIGKNIRSACLPNTAHCSREARADQSREAKKRFTLVNGPGGRTPGTRIHLARRVLCAVERGVDGSATRQGRREPLSSASGPAGGRGPPRRAGRAACQRPDG